MGYKLKITVEPIKVEDDGTERSYGTTEQVYLGLNYAEMVMVQKTAIFALFESLSKLGDDRIEQEANANKSKR